MISYIRLLLIGFIAISNQISAKETYCYKLIESSEPTIKTGGVQFISFIGDQCYESSLNGAKIHEGKLNKNSYQSSSNKIVYNGKCFCGSGAKFEFSPDKTTLTVISNAGSIFKFIKISPPSGVRTSAYLVEESSDSYHKDGFISGSIPESAYNSSSNYFNNSSGSYSNSNSSPTLPSRRFKCAYCDGGTIERNDNAPATYGQSRPRQKCPTCGKWYDPNVVTHYHQTCRHCGGTGYAK